LKNSRQKRGKGIKQLRMRIRNKKELIKLILAKVEELCKTIKTKPPKTKRERPPKYPDHIILFALLLKVLENLSLRDLEEGKAPRPRHPVV